LKLPRGGQGPRYDQLKQAIRGRIQSGQWPVGFRLPTMRQLSAELGVAYATVERAVRELADEGLLEGRKRGGTRVASPRVSRQNTIGVLGTMPYDRLKSQSMYGLALSNLLQERILANHCTVVYEHWREGLPLHQHFNGLSLVDGLIMFGTWSRLEQFQQVQAIYESGRPLVYLGETTTSPITTINSADTQDSFRAVSRLIADGHERIVMIGHPFSAAGTTFLARVEGFKAAMARTTLGFRDEFLIVEEMPAAAQRMLRMKPAPTAVFVPIVRSFPELYEHLRGSACEPGARLAVAAYDENLWHKIRPLGIPFISIEQPMEAIADRAVQTLLRMRDDRQFRPGHIEIPSTMSRVDAAGRTTLLD
jgi:DNA-binding LacI/PurR family transcriptional regulator